VFLNSAYHVEKNLNIKAALMIQFLSTGAKLKKRRRKNKNKQGGPAAQLPDARGARRVLG